MANKRPEYFYHPAVGVVSPASLGLFRLNAAKAPVEPPPVVFSEPVPAAPVSHFTDIPAPVPPVQVTMQSTSVTPAQAGVHSPVPAMASGLRRNDDGVNTLPLPPAIPAPRKAMTLSRTETCVVTGEVEPLTNLIRFVVNPDKEIVPDLAEKLPGQYFYITASLPVLQKAIWRNTFATVARDNVTVPDNLLKVLESGLSRMGLETLSLAKRAGQLLAGFTSVDEQLRKEPEGVYVVAADASDHGRYKLEKLMRTRPGLDLWTSAELSAALGEANTNHLLLAPGGLAEKLLRIAKKLKAVRSDT